MRRHTGRASMISGIQSRVCCTNAPSQPEAQIRESKEAIMPKSLSVLDQCFPSQKAAENFFYGIRDENIASGGEITSSAVFDLLRELYVKYCEYTNWPMTAEPVAFYARNIGRGVGVSGGTTQGFVVKFSDGNEQEFSAKRAIQAIANR